MKRAGDGHQRDLVVRDQTLTGTSVAGDVCARTAKMLKLVQDEVGREGIRNVRQTTLESWFVGHISKEVTMCDK